MVGGAELLENVVCLGECERVDDDRSPRGSTGPGPEEQDQSTQRWDEVTVVRRYASLLASERVWPKDGHVRAAGLDVGLDVIH